jgi:O-antigen ligase
LARVQKARSRSRPQAKYTPLFRATAIFLAIWVLFGGNMPTSVLLFGILALSGTAMAVFAVIQGAGASLRDLHWPAWIMLALFFAVMLFQLVPLPPAWWQALPGRSLSVDTLTATGMADAWHPATLAFPATLRSLMVYCWLIAFLLAVLHLSTEEFRKLFGVLLILGLVNVGIGVIQVASGNTALKLYTGLNSPFLNGLFANKNHTGLFIALTYLAGYATLYGEHGWNRRRIGVVLPVTLVLFVALLATFSRAGVIFGVMALGFLALLSMGSRLRGRSLYILLGVLAGTAVLLSVVASTDLATRAFARFGGVSGDLRWSIWQWSWPLVGQYFPAGAGVGSFTAVFPSAEQLAWVKPTYVNHAHNDYLEQLIEIGAVAPVLWLLVLLALVGPLYAAWTERRQQSGRIAMIGAAMLLLIALHSVVDYPLRRPAIAATCMVALAALLRMNARKKRLYRQTGYVRQRDTIAETAYEADARPD